MKSSNAVLLATAACGIFTSTQVIAQAEADQATQAAPAEAAATDRSEIIVTARRRAETLQDVPISVSAFDDAKLQQQGIATVTDLGNRVPSLSVTTAGGFRSQLAFAIRGQRTNETQLLTDPPVGLYFAEVNQPRTAGFGWAMYDLQDVQVLKGVQGTLFGRNMTGGAVLIEPAHPTMDFDASFKGQIGDYSLRSLEGMINVPVMENLALRVAGKIYRRDGYITDISNGRDYSNDHYDSGRASLLYDDGTFSNLLIGDYIRSKNHSTGLIGDFSQNTGALGAYSLINAAYNGAFGPSRIIPNDPAFGSFAGLTVVNPVSDVAGQIAAQRAILASKNPYRIQGTSIGSGGPFDYPNSDNSLPYEYVRNWGITNKTTVDLGGATLKNIFGYRKIDVTNLADLDGLPANLISSKQVKDIEEISEELQLQGDLANDKLHYTIGAFYFRESGSDGSQSSQFPELATAFGAPNTASARLTGFKGSGAATSYAGYAAATYDISDEFKISGGLRYTHDKRSVVERPVGAPDLTGCTFDPSGLDGVIGTADDIVVGADCSVRRSKNWDALTYDITLQWQPTSDTNAYAAFRKGFRAGGFSLRATNAATLEPFDPETVYEYEIGLKNRFDMGGGVLRTSIAGFYQDYRNVQEQNPTAISTPSGPQVITVIQNIAKKRIVGGEFEANLAVGNFEAGLNFAYVDVKTLKTAPSLENVYPQQGIPKLQVGMNGAWHIPIGDTSNVGELTLSGDISLRSKIYLDDKDVGAIQPSYILANARINWDNILGSNFNAGAFVTNITNQFYRVGVIGIVEESGIGSSAYGEPRMYGFSLGYKF